jgi:hypothetical protein
MLKIRMHIPPVSKTVTGLCLSGLNQAYGWFLVKSNHCPLKTIGEYLFSENVRHHTCHRGFLFSDKRDLS